MNTLIHRNNALKDKVLASNVYMGNGSDKYDTVEKRIDDIEKGEGVIGSFVVVTPLLSEGVHIANIRVNGVNRKIYAPEGGSGNVNDVLVDGTSVVDQYGNANIDITGKQDVLIPGDNVTISDNVISATDTTYSEFVGATSQDDGESGLVPAPTSSDTNKYLRGDGTWAEVSGGTGNVDDVRVDGVSVVTNRIAEIDLTGYAPLSSIMNYVFPTSVSTSSISDGGNANVMTFEFYCNSAVTFMQFASCLNFTVTTTVNTQTNTYCDCTLTITFTLDETTVTTMTQTYVDGNQILSLAYSLFNIAQGNHVLTVNFAASGGSIS